MKIPSRMVAVSNRAENREENSPPAVPTKNIVRMAISVGNLPLQGTKLLVRIANNRSRGESMILHPTMPGESLLAAGTAPLKGFVEIVSYARQITGVL